MADAHEVASLTAKVRLLDDDILSASLSLSLSPHTHTPTTGKRRGCAKGDKGEACEETKGQGAP